MPFVYVLHSSTTGRFYTGATTNLEQRLSQHNANLSRSTKNRGPWKLIYHEELATLAEALRRERYLKTGRGREELRNAINELQPQQGSGLS